jgi:hypothetical protein
MGLFRSDGNEAVGYCDSCRDHHVVNGREEGEDGSADSMTGRCNTWAICMTRNVAIGKRLVLMTCTVSKRGDSQERHGKT